MNRRYFLYAGAAVAAVAGAGYFFADRNDGVDATSATAEGGDPLAGLMRTPLPDLDGKARRLSEWRGQPMVVNFWATWCAPCVKEMPELDALQKNHPGVRFVGIGIDTAEKMQEFVRKVPVSYPLLVMGTGAIDTLRQLGNPAGGLPFTLVFNADGSVNRTILGQIDPADLEKTVAALKS